MSDWDVTDITAYATASHEPSPRAVTRDKLIRLITDFQGDENEVLLFIARRLRKGAVDYGRLDVNDPTRNWRTEESEEHADALVYHAADAIKRLRSGK